MLLLGLTGDIACGKSTVARWLVERGAAHLDADLQVRELYDNAHFARDLAQHLHSSHDEDRVLDAQLPNVLDTEGKIDRRALGQWVFGNEKRLKALEEWVHPAVAALREQQIDALRRSTQPPPVVVVEAVKLVESGQAEGCDAVWWITATREVQMQRLTQERGLSEQEAQLRLLHQPDAAQKRALLDTLGVPYQFIDNSATRADLERQLELLWAQLQNTMA
jgi:dephospho-CoA kinase